MSVCIAYYTLDEGFGIASFDCGHWAQLGKVTILKTPCPVCAQIKTAREEVLKLIEEKMRYPVTFPKERQWKIFIYLRDILTI